MQKCLEKLIERYYIYIEPSHIEDVSEIYQKD